MIESVFAAKRTSLVAGVFRATVRAGPPIERARPKSDASVPEPVLHEPQRTHPSTLLMILRNSTGGP